MKQAGKKPAVRKTSTRPVAKKSASVKKPAPTASTPRTRSASQTQGKSGGNSSGRARAGHAVTKPGKAQKGKVQMRPSVPVIMKREPTAAEILYKKNLAQFENGLKIF